MFGIDQISWGQFSLFILGILFLWYLSIVLIAVVKQNSNRKTLFEDDQFTPGLSEGLQPIAVSSQDYPSELIPIHFAEAILLPVSFYEETGLEEGYPIDNFLNPNDSHLPKILEQIQFQQ